MPTAEIPTRGDSFSSSRQNRTSFNPEGGAATSKNLINSWLNDRQSMESFGSVPISLSQQSLGPRRQSWMNLMDSEETLGKRSSVSMAMLPSITTESDGGGGGLTKLSAMGKRRNPSGASKTSQAFLQNQQDEFLLMVRKIVFSKFKQNVE